MHYDVIVIGAGPAGACAAYETATRGLRTLLLERRKMPRYKACGGGIPVNVRALLPDFAPDAFVESTVTHLRHTWKFGDAHLASLNPNEGEPPMSLWMVQRSIFDQALANRAAEAGCDVRDDAAVTKIEPDGQTAVRVAAKAGETYHASWVIGADGANGVCAACAGLRQTRSLAVALEAEVPFDWSAGADTLRPEIAHLEYAVPRGYAWVFPKAGHLSVGAGVFGGRTQEGRGAVKKDELLHWIFGYLNSLGVKYRPGDLELHGHPLPLWSGGEPLEAWNGRLALAGDAAGLVNPLFGDGISYACRSGILAGRAAAARKLGDWTAIVREEFAANQDAALSLARFFYRFPAVCYKMGVKHPRGTRIAGRLIAGDISFDSMIDRVPWRGRMRKAEKDGKMGFL